ncbi:hypothetical protein CEK28_14885 [Xenophilus sp. AP218F]|nr:hypothetical protein CEK28_14885 [Xenophilus sp. AP218F]
MPDPDGRSQRIVLTRDLSWQPQLAALVALMLASRLPTPWLAPGCVLLFGLWALSLWRARKPRATAVAWVINGRLVVAGPGRGLRSCPLDQVRSARLWYRDSPAAVGVAFELDDQFWISETPGCTPAWLEWLRHPLRPECDQALRRQLADFCRAHGIALVASPQTQQASAAA